MKRWWFIIPFALALFLVTSTAFALDLKECIQLGMANSDRIMAAKAEWDRSRMVRDASIGNFLPGMSVQASKMWLDVSSNFNMSSAMSVPPGVEPSFAQQFGLMMSQFDFSSLTTVPNHRDDITLQVAQPLTQLPMIGFYDKMAKDGRELARLGYEVTQDQVAIFLSSSYFNVLNIRKKVETLKKALEQVERLNKDAQNMMDQGLITKADLLKFDMRRIDVKMQLFQAENDLQYAKSYLAKLLDLPVDRIDCTDADVALREPHDLSWYIEHGQKERRELRMTSLQESIARSNRTAAYLNMVPSIVAVGQAEWTDDGLITTPDRTYSAGFMLSWNFWVWGKDFFTARAAGYAKDKAIHEAKSSRIEIMSSIENAWRNDLVAHEGLASTQSILKQAEENFRIEQNRYKTGKSTASDLLGAQTQLTGAETGVAGARYGAILADAALLLAIGYKPFPEIMGGKSDE